jgi:hypothetical protein
MQEFIRVYSKKVSYCISGKFSYFTNFSFYAFLFIIRRIVLKNKKMFSTLNFMFRIADFFFQTSFLLVFMCFAFVFQFKIGKHETKMIRKEIFVLKLRTERNTTFK